MKERFLPGVIAGAVAVGGIGMVAEGITESQSEIDRRQDAEILEAYRTAVDADRTSALLYLYLTQTPGRPYNLEEYRLKFEQEVEAILNGADPLSEGFRSDPGLAEPSPTPTTIFEEGGEGR